MLTENKISEELKSLSGWSYENNSISKEYKLKDFISAVEAIKRIAIFAEQMDHHPDLFLHSYNKLKITLSTHSQGGVTEKDFELAKNIEKAVK
ncbi:MAG TPA: 4a-hydroxytetrahydrobiopterin dehydratase [Ignavibacteriales bacterium]|nr:4a-hydroxytetrahydrobiopterin dehydratase [Ignavibacteriales bacterium]